MAVRAATPADLESLTRVLIVSSDDDPCYPYRFPWRHHYQAQYKEHCRRKCWEYLTTNTVDVYEVADLRGDKKVVAFSVWDPPKGHRPRAQRSQTWPRWGLWPLSNRTDDDRHPMNPPHPLAGATAAAVATAGTDPRPSHLTRTPSQPKPFAREDRARAFREASKAARARFFDAKSYLDGVMFLKILLCDPDHRNRGAGTALVRRGVAVAQLHGVPTALFSSPMGLHLYRKLGFREIGGFEVRVEGDDCDDHDGGVEKLDIPAMLLPAPGGPVLRSRRGSTCAVEVTPPEGLRKCSTHNATVSKKVYG
jgi:GNAT superfamily N-acetyltransferase